MKANLLFSYTHIIYLDVPAEVVAQRRQIDPTRIRSPASVAHLRRWQEVEKTRLQDLCMKHQILFTVLTSARPDVVRVSSLLQDFRAHSEKHNLSSVSGKLDKILGKDRKELKTVIVLDADRTLAAEDAGNLFWEEDPTIEVTDGWGNRVIPSSPLKKLFGSSMEYTYKAFRQAMLLYESAADDTQFEARCKEVAAKITMHPELVSLLQAAEQAKDVRAVVVTCGLSRVWEMVLEREGLSEGVKVIGGGRVNDQYVVTPEVKRHLAHRMKKQGLYVCAFGDSPMDLEMLWEANKAVVVVGEMKTRSKTMDDVLSRNIDIGTGLQACQVLLPPHAEPRLDTTKLPIVKITDQAFIREVFGREKSPSPIRVFDSSKKNSTLLLMTPTRDASVSGPKLREAHRQIGFHLAITHLSNILGTSEYPITHVQGQVTAGHRFRHEEKTTIVALMRGGEPMALGVNDALPLALFVHANKPKDIKSHHIEGQLAIVLVDSVINSGKTVVDFVKHVRGIHATIRIVIVAGVVQAGSVAKDGTMARDLGTDINLSVVALRLSDNKFTGIGGTDTGNRLFNTTHLP